jgi:integrase/recombinase XerC
MTLQNAVQGYLDHKQFMRRVSPASVATYRAHLRRFAAAVGPERPVNPAMGRAEAFLLELSRRGRSDNYARKAFQVLRDFGTWACAKGRARKNPLHDHKAPMVHATRKVFLSRGQVGALLTAARRSRLPLARRDHALLATLYYTLLRVSEACQARPEDFDLDRCTVRVVGKGGKAALIEFDPRLAPILRDYLRGHRPGPSPMMFPSQARADGRCGVLGRTRVELLMREVYGPAAGLPRGATPHALRRSGADHLRQAGVALKTIQEMLRHDSIETTMEYLQVSTPDEIRGAWRKR